jgi:class 3 adenylate cyclase/predicted ATPase
VPTIASSERRQITVLFSDLVGSTQLSHQLDPEDLSVVLREYQREVNELVQRLDGYVAQYLGDGILIYFGWPVAHEDDAERAVRAGLAIAEAATTLDRRFQERLSAALRLRVGIHTGEVLIGEIGGDSRQERLALGETPNVAARILGVADPGCVVVSAATRALVGRRFEFEDLGIHMLKGIAEPFRISKVVRVVDTASRFDASAHEELTPLVGRKQELGLLRDRWRLAQGGDGQVVLLGAEPGLGKSRLLRELQQKLSSELPTVLRFECSPFHINSAYHPIINHLEQTLGFHRDMDPDQKLAALEQLLIGTHGLSARALGLIAAILGIPLQGHDMVGTMAPRTRKNDTLVAVVDLICSSARERGGLVLFEDAHWADPTTVEFLDLLIARTAQARLLVVVTHRPEFAPGWARYGQVAAIALSNLSRGQAAAVISGMAGRKTLPTALVDEIVSKAGGVPLFLEEVTRTVLESGQLRERDGRLELATEIAKLDVPVTLRASLMARLDRHPGAKEVAQIGSVIGHSFDARLLGELGILEPHAVAAGVDRLVAAGLALRDGIGDSATYNFRHALVHDLAYESVPRARRRSVHCAIAEALERAPDGRHVAPELLAHHWTRGGRPEKAVPYWHRAGQNSLEYYANVEAIGHLTRGIALLDELPDSTERMQRLLDMQIALGAPLIATKGYAAPEVRDCFDRALDVCRRVGATPERFHALWGLAAFYLIRAELSTARQLAQECLALAEEEHDNDRVLEAHSWLGTILFYVADMEGAERHFDAALTIYNARRHHLHAVKYGLDPAILCLAHTMWMRWLGGRAREALSVEQETLASARRVAHPLSLVHALNFAAVHHLFRAEAQATWNLVEEEVAISQEHHFPHYVAYATILGGWARASQGGSSPGVAQILKGMAARRAMGAELARPLFLTLLAESHRADGNQVDALAALDEAEQIIERREERWWEPEVCRLRGELLFELSSGASGGMQEEARRLLHRALRLAEDHASRALELRAATSLLRFALRTGSQDVWEARTRLEDTLEALGAEADGEDVQQAKRLLSES